MLDDGDASSEQQRVGGPFGVGDVVDVERVDADECCTVVDKPAGAGPGEEVPVFRAAISASPTSGAGRSTRNP